jgi:hypothetical protein
MYKFLKKVGLILGWDTDSAEVWAVCLVDYWCIAGWGLLVVLISD